MSAHVLDSLPEWALGIAGTEVERHLASCPTCREEAKGYAEAAAALAPAPSAAPVAVLARLFGSVAVLERFSAFAPDVAALLDVDRDRARRVLHLFSDDDGWSNGPFPGVSWRGVRPGPARSGCTALLAKILPGSEIPVHRHLAPETMLVLQGELRDDHGAVVAAGASLRNDEGSAHAVRAGAAPGVLPCYCVVVNEGAVAWG